MQAEVFGVDGAIILLFVVAVYGVGVWALIDACVRPNRAYMAIRSNKALWIVGIVISIWLSLPALVVGGIYLGRTRPSLRAAS